jgi:predicted phage terminase large subunit-like protein
MNTDLNLRLTFAEYQALLRLDLMTFMERAFHHLNPEATFAKSPHIEVLATKLAACRHGKLRRFIVCLPPRMLKSIAVTVAFPAWLLGHDPTRQIICASYGQDLSDKHARDSRNVMTSDFYKALFPRTRLSPEKQSVNDFMTTAQGFRMSTSVGGVLTGRGADVIVLDDPLKPDDALSETKRNAANEWFDNTLLSRLNSKETGIIVIVMQRVHQDDLVGHVLDRGGWEVLCLPAIAAEDEEHLIEDPLGRRWFRRKAGEALQPERESLETLKNIRENLGTYNFSAQYQQNPVPIGGAIVKTEWLRFYEPCELPSGFRLIVQSWDTANKGGELNNFSVCTTWLADFENHYLIDVFRKRLDYPNLKRAVKEQAQKHNADIIIIEDKASGTQLIQDLRADGVCGLEPYDPGSGIDKRMRLYAVSAEFESGRARLPRSASWKEEYIREITGFPGTKYDDQVDSTSQALEHLKTTVRSRLVWSRL